MRRVVAALIAVGGLSIIAPAANAADMPVYKAEPLPVWTWAGVYFGAHAGGAWGRSHWDTNFPCVGPAAGPIPICETVDQRPGGWVVGGQAGARWQWGTWVFGLEGTLAAAAIRANDFSPCASPFGALIVGACAGLPFTDTHYDTQFSTLYSATAQIGYAFNRTLWYVKGGWAGGEVRRKGENPIGFAFPLIFAGDTRQAHGWTVGTGIEYLVLQNLSLGIEYDYFRLRASGFSSCFIPVPNCAAPAIGTDLRADIHQVVARANYRLDWGVLWGGPAPVAARY